MSRITFFVAGVPKSMKIAGVARFQRGDKIHMVPKRGNTEWALLVGQIGRAHAPDTPCEGPMALTLRFYMPRPKNARRAKFPLTRPDFDNLLHKLSDQFNGVFWRDDSQVVDLVAVKRFDAGKPGLEIVVESIDA